MKKFQKFFSGSKVLHYFVRFLCNNKNCRKYVHATISNLTRLTIFCTQKKKNSVYNNKIELFIQHLNGFVFFNNFQSLLLLTLVLLFFLYFSDSFLILLNGSSNFESTLFIFWFLRIMHFTHIFAYCFLNVNLIFF